jgi:ABC-2 type transport system permease protein
VEPLFRRGVARAALVIPRGFGRERGRGGDAAAQFLLDGSDNTTASIALGYANTVALGATQASLAQILGRFDPPVELRARTFFNPRLQSAVVLVPGLMVIVLVMVCVMLTALTVAREYERGSMEQLFATPVGRLEIVLGKLAPYFLIGIADVLLVLAAGVLLFDVPVNGNLAILFVVASLFILAMFAQGLVISIVARSQMLASQMAMISTMLPAMLLSGFVFPIENMPLPLRIVARVMPARYLVHTLRSVMLRGNGWSVVWPDAVATAAFLAFMLLIATRRFRRSLG